MKRALVIALLASVAVANADDKILVLKAEGRADKKVRAKVEKAVLELAKSTGEPTTAGDITFGDAAAMVGCKPEEDTCKDQVLEMLSVDEVITIATTPKPGGIEVSVRRIGKGGVTRTAATIVTADKSDQLEPIAPLFGKAGPPSPLPPPTPAVTTTPPSREPIREPARTEPPPPVPPPAQVADPIPPPMITAETAPPVEPTDERPRGNRRLATIGMAGGGVMLVTGLVFWASASSIEGEIADAPKRTRDDLQKVQDLEEEGDAYAAAGNILVAGGLILGGVSTYYFLKAGKRSARSARITPTVVNGGGGIAITWGTP